MTVDVVEMAAACRYDPLLWSSVAYDWGYGELAGYDAARRGGGGGGGGGVR